MKTISVKLPTPMAVWLGQQARELGSTRSAIVRSALERERQGQRAVSCHDLGKNYCGIMKGPRDASVNPRYLEGFGQ
jgi:hypothetical protein